MTKINREGGHMEVETVLFDSVSTNRMDYGGGGGGGGDGDNKVVELPGFRFHPTDGELVGFYLKRMVEKKPISVDLIKHIDIYKYDPWDLPRESRGGEREWYFFCKRGRKYRNSVRPNRVTGSGFWKATGIDKPIFSLAGLQDCIGLKKSLVYYRGNAGKGTKTDWMMHEFRLPSASRSTTAHAPADNYAQIINNDLQEAEVWTLCRIFKREVSYKRNASECRQKTRLKQSVNNIVIYDTPSANCAGSLELKHQPILTAMKPCETEPLWDQYLHERNFIFAAGHLNLLATTQNPEVMASPLSSPNIPNEDQWLGGENWDELRPVVDFLLSTYRPLAIDY